MAVLHGLLSGLVVTALVPVASRLLAGDTRGAAAWLAVLLCGVPIIKEGAEGLFTRFDIKADVLVSLALLASVIIGEVLFGTRSFKNCLISVILGSIVYRAVIAVVLQMGMPPNDLKLFTAILVAIALSLPLIQARFNAFRKAVKK